MQNLDALLIFIRVAEMTSFTRAAESFGVQKGRVSTVIRIPERDVSVVLLHRTTRSMQLAEDGCKFYVHARDLLAKAQELQSIFLANGGPLRGRPRINLPIELAHSVVVPALPQLVAAHSELQLELSSTSRRVDLVQKGFDYMIRFGPITNETMIARPLGKLCMTNAASPAYLERYGVPHTLEDPLSQGHQMVHYALTLGARHAGWQYPDGDGCAWLPLPSAMQVNGVQTYHAAGLAGIGLIQAGYTALASHIQSGVLVEMLPRLHPESLPTSFVMTHRRNLLPHIRVFVA